MVVHWYITLLRTTGIRICERSNVPSNSSLQLRAPATAPSRKFLHDLTTARHFKKFFVMYTKRIFTIKTENSGCAVTTQCAREHFCCCAAAPPRSLDGTLERSLSFFKSGLPCPTHICVSRFYPMAGTSKPADTAPCIRTKFKCLHVQST
jgi:hypothetical protein